MRKQWSGVVVLWIGAAVALGGCGGRQRRRVAISRRPAPVEVASLEAQEDLAADLRVPAGLRAPTMVRPEPEPSHEKEAVCQFAFDESELGPEERTVLDDMMASVDPDQINQVEIAGHCCSIGTDEWNAALGERRAQAVANYLHVVHAVPREKMVPMSFGESLPTNSNDSREGRVANRRSDVILIHGCEVQAAD